MKKYTLIFIVFAGLFWRCDKAVEPLADLEPYAKPQLEIKGGLWSVYLLKSDQFDMVSQPEASSSNAYQTELQELKTIQSSLTDQQRGAVRYWGAGAVIRWHEIAREIAAEYNVPPNYNADGTYPAPDPNNPGVYPRFPFANPPYVARALALLAVAQYDGLVAAWHNKFKYNRLAPYQYDSQIQTLLPTNELPSYPSEDAVVAVASREILVALFPNEKAFLEAKAEEHLNSRLWAGANVRSDLAAAEIIGKAAAQAVLEYAKTDGMKDANAQSKFQAMRDSAAARGYTDQWVSLDLPSRAPMLPYFGFVKTWNMTRSQLESIRPAAPPQPGSAEFEVALDELRDIAKNRTREQFRIAAYWADGVGSYTPPGHWNKTACSLIYENQLNELRAARVMALVQTAVHDAGVACWDTKYYYLLPRPTQIDREVTTSTGIPNFPAYTSGHSSFSAAGAEVLSHLFPSRRAEMEARALEASLSRIYGCIHYRFDCEVGLLCGKLAGGFAVERAKNDNSDLE